MATGKRSGEEIKGYRIKMQGRAIYNPITPSPEQRVGLME
jgi:hypothetical protein